LHKALVTSHRQVAKRAFFTLRRTKLPPEEKRLEAVPAALRVPSGLESSLQMLLFGVGSGIRGSGVHLIAVPIYYSENTRVLVDELRSAVPAAVIPGGA
jgi:hypothetical protein